ncbi:MAG: hypothetical protein ACLP66_16525 [Polyangia bacterium]
MGDLLLPLWATILLLGISIVLISGGVWNLLRRFHIAWRISVAGGIAVAMSCALYGLVNDRVGRERLSHFDGKLYHGITVTILRAVITDNPIPYTITKENPYVAVTVAPPLLINAPQREWWVIVEGMILNHYDVPLGIKGWRIDLHPLSYDTTVATRNMSIPAGFVVKDTAGANTGKPFYVEDFWPAKLDMHPIPPGGVSSGWTSAILHLSAESVDIRNATLSLQCLDLNDNVHSASIIYKGPLGI